MTTSINRRELLKWLGAGSVVTLASLMTGSCDVSPEAPIKNSKATTPGTGRGEFPFYPNGLPVLKGTPWPVRTVDLQELEQVLSTWRLKVGVQGTRAKKVYTFSDLIALPRSSMTVDFHCVEGWSVYDVPWDGVHLKSILEDMGFTPTQSHVTFHTIGGRYNESLPLEIALEEKSLLAYGVGGYTLPLNRGFPLRLVVPKLLAYKSAKYVETIEFTNARVEGFWVARGYPYEGIVTGNRLRKGKY